MLLKGDDFFHIIFNYKANCICDPHIVFNILQGFEMGIQH